MTTALPGRSSRCGSVTAVIPAMSCAASAARSGSRSTLASRLPGRAPKTNRASPTPQPVPGSPIVSAPAANAYCNRPGSGRQEQVKHSRRANFTACAKRDQGGAQSRLCWSWAV